jgi:hypothetical protein
MQQETRNRIRNRQIVMAPIESRPDQSDCNTYPHLEAVTISKQIELEGWGLSQPLHLFRVLSESILFGTFICNRRLAIASEIDKS